MQVWAPSLRRDINILNPLKHGGTRMMFGFENKFLGEAAGIGDISCRNEIY